MSDREKLQAAEKEVAALAAELELSQRGDVDDDDDHDDHDGHDFADECEYSYSDDNGVEDNGVESDDEMDDGQTTLTFTGSDDDSI